jgi:hypothetical protein
MKSLIIIFISILFLSCDPSYTTTFCLQNNIDDSIKVEFFSNGIVSFDKNVPSYSTVVLSQSSGLGGSPGHISFESYDSIRVSNSLKFILFYRDSTTNNSIYNMENWIETNEGKHNYSYTYVFDDDMFDYVGGR